MWLCCAQRLSASRMNGPPADALNLVAILACSTPFGITDEWTRSATVVRSTATSCAQRLSASRMNGPPAGRGFAHRRFRAQRLSASRMNGQSAGTAVRGALPCAQRLSASRMNGPSVRATTHSEVLGAQRLSASRMNGLAVEPQGADLTHVHSVLNAFRHHG